MKLNANLIVPVLLGALLLTACGKKDEAATEVAPATESVPAEAPVTDAAPAASGAGGYEPTAEERVPGITLDAAAPAAEVAPAAEEPAPAEAAPAEAN